MTDATSSSVVSEGERQVVPAAPVAPVAPQAATDLDCEMIPGSRCAPCHSAHCITRPRQGRGACGDPESHVALGCILGEQTKEWHAKLL